MCSHLHAHTHTHTKHLCVVLFTHHISHACNRRRHTSLFFSLLTAVFSYQPEHAEKEQTHRRGKISWAQKIPVARARTQTHTHTQITCVCRFCLETTSSLSCLSCLKQNNKSRGNGERFRPKPRMLASAVSATTDNPVTTDKPATTDTPACWSPRS